MGWYTVKSGRGCLVQYTSKIANNKLVKHLEPYGYAPVTPRLWSHNSRLIIFTLVVNDFRIKYIDQHGVKHLQNSLKHIYVIPTDDTGSLYCGLALD